MYLQIPYSEKLYKDSDLVKNGGNVYSVSPSKYTPTKGDTNHQYYRLNLEDKEKYSDDYDGRYIDDLIKSAFGVPISVRDEYGNIEKSDDYFPSLNIGQNRISRALRGLLGSHTVGRGYDNKGEYVSYYDLWDLAPINRLGEDQSGNIGNPIHFYDRIYLDDYYEVPEEYRPYNRKDGDVYYGGYLPEVVSVKKNKQGSKLIPRKRFLK